MLFNQIYMKNITLKYKPIKEFLIEKKLEKGHSNARIAKSLDITVEKVDSLSKKLAKK